MVTVGVHVRTMPGCERGVMLELERLEGIDPIVLEEPGALGILISDDDLESAHARLRDQVTRLKDVLVAWPVHLEW